MPSVNVKINNLLNQHPAIVKCLKQDLINTRSLARFLIQEYHLTFSLDAVISAIRRYDLKETPVEKLPETAEVFRQMRMSFKDEMARIVIKDAAFSEVAEDYLHEKILKENVRIIKAKETVTLILSQKDLPKKIALFQQKEILSLHQDLAEIRLEFGQDIKVIKGLLATLASELAVRDVILLDIIHAPPEILLYVTESELVKAHMALKEMKK